MMLRRLHDIRTTEDVETQKKFARPFANIGKELGESPLAVRDTGQIDNMMQVDDEKELVNPRSVE